MQLIRNFLDRYRHLSWVNSLSRAIMASPIIYFVFLSLYCFILAFLKRDAIPALAILPFIYSYLTPSILLVVLPLINFIAFVLYRDRRFFLEGCAGWGCASIFFIGIAFFFVWGMGLYQAAEQPLLFNRIDLVFIIVSLWDLVITMLFSTEQETKEEDYTFSWLKQLNEAAAMSIGIQGRIMLYLMLIPYLFQYILKINDVQFGLFWLSLVYLSYAFLRRIYGVSPPRKSFVTRQKSQAYLRKLYPRFGKSDIELDEEEEELELPQS